ncbi:MAG: hypothetical protein K8M05_15045, partial [Deltaproteobacteria bacterium]|nr:hypothetical protein [Kofleriaceae bacterium]
CMTRLWRERQPRALFAAEAERAARGPGPCDVFFERAPGVLACDRTPLAVRSRLAGELMALRTHWDEDGVARTPELELYDICLAALSQTMGIEDCTRPE